MTLPVRLDLHPVSALCVRLVVRRGTTVLATLGTWSPAQGWDLTAAGCAAPRVLRVLPAVVARYAAGRGEAWQPEAARGPWLDYWDGNRMVPRFRADPFTTKRTGL